MIDLEEEQNNLFNPRSLWHLAFLGFILLLAVLVRFDEIQAPGHLIDREYTSAIFARAFFFENNPNIEPSRQALAAAIKNHQPVLEPPITELLVSWIYRIMGKEEVWYSRFLTNAFWLIGAIFFYLLSRTLLTRDSALIATGFYLFNPMGIEISRSFQPDALMMLSFMASLYLITRYFEHRTWKLLILAGSVAGLTLLHRPLVLFTMMAFFYGMTIFTNRNAKEPWWRMFDARFVLFNLLALLSMVIYYGYGIFVASYMNWKIATSFKPFLLTNPEFWRGWFDIDVSVIGPTALLLAVVGFALIPKGRLRVFILSQLVGYLIFGMVFTYHTHTHPYYHIQLIPIVGICAAPLIEHLIRLLKRSQNISWQAITVLLVVCSIYFAHKELRSKLYAQVVEPPNVDQQIGDIVNHSTRTVFVAYHYGIPLEYFGELTGVPWPERIEDPFYRAPGEKERSVQERIESLGFKPEYYVITNLNLFNAKNSDLKSYLNENCYLVANTGQYLVYSKCEMVIYK